MHRYLRFSSKLCFSISMSLMPGMAIGVECEPYTFVAASVIHKENSSPASLTFNVMRIGDVTRQVSVGYSTQNLTADSGRDFIATSGTLIFYPNEVLKQVNVGIVQDVLFEPPESFQLILSGKGTQPPITNGLATIVDDDLPIGTGTYVCPATRVYWNSVDGYSGLCTGLAPPMVVGEVKNWHEHRVVNDNPYYVGAARFNCSSGSWNWVGGYDPIDNNGSNGTICTPITQPTIQMCPLKRVYWGNGCTGLAPSIGPTSARPTFKVVNDRTGYAGHGEFICYATTSGIDWYKRTGGFVDDVCTGVP